MSTKSAPVRQPEPKLTDQRTLDCTIDVLSQHFALKAEGYVCQTADVWRVVTAAAARQSTIEAMTRVLRDVPDSNTVRGQLNLAFAPTEVRASETQCNAALASQLPAWLTRRPVELACDLHDAPYYGKAEAQDPEHPANDPDYWVCRGQKRDGTTRFYRCASAYVMRRGMRWTVAVHWVHPGETDAQILEALLTRVQALKIQLVCLYLDKGFTDIPTIRWLQQQPFPTLLAVPLWGTEDGRGVKPLCCGRRSYYTEHRFASQANGEVVVPLAMVRARLLRHPGRHNAHWEWQWMAFALINFPQLPPLRHVRRRYRRRFGIESSYRLVEDVRVRTATNNPAVRFVYLAVAFLLQALWITLHWAYLRVAGPGPRRVDAERFRFEDFKSFLIHAIEAFYGVVSVLDSPPALAKSVMY